VNNGGPGNSNAKIRGDQGPTLIPEIRRNPQRKQAPEAKSAQVLVCLGIGVTDVTAQSHHTRGADFIQRG